MSKPSPATIRIGTLAERLRASAAVPLDKALEGVRAHGPKPTRPPPEVAALEFLAKSKQRASSKASADANTATEPNTTSDLIPKRAG
jgi:hypothetical protein